MPTIEAAARALRSGTTTSVALTDACLAVIEAQSQALGAFITVTADEAREAAHAADRERAAGHDRGPLHGIPVSLKDLIDLAGVPTTAASRVREGHVARADAVVTARLKASGAVIVGKTNLHEFAFGTTNEDSAYGPARHPLAPQRSPGGSSGGSAVSVATGMALASIGTDTGGSARIPAAACGLIGLKPTSGEIPVEGVVPLSTTFDHVGPLCQTVGDTRIVYNILRGALPDADAHPRPLRGVRLGLPRAYFLAMLDDEVARAFDTSCEALTAAGVTLVPVDLALTETIAAIYLHVSLPEAAAYHTPTLEQMPERYTPNVRTRLEAGRYLLAEDYVRAQQGRLAVRAAVDAALEGCDALVTPTLAIPAPTIGAQTVRIGERDEPVRNVMLRLTQPFNVSGHPAIALPNGRTAEGMPTSLQLVGRRHQTPALLNIAQAIEPVIKPASS